MTYCLDPLPFHSLYNSLPSQPALSPRWEFPSERQYSVSYSCFPEYTTVTSPHHRHHDHPTPPTSDHTMAHSDVDDMEQFQQLSDHYQPSLPGPLIGSRKPLSELVTEYAQADPTFVAKTQALAATHSAYRQIKGDGQCGWRGAVFGYFELLFRSGDMNLVTQEEVRLRSHEQTMRSAGIDYDIIIDMFDYTWELFDAVKSAIERGDTSEAVVLQSLNDENVSNSIVYHFKMMTSSFMEIHPERYEAFLEMSVQQYRLTRIDPSNQEIDHVGLQALTDAVIAPAYITVEVSYLDRSTGDEVTSYEFVDNAEGWPAIRLIYRPGHYDIIYKDDPNSHENPQPLQINLATDAPYYIPTPREEVFRSTDPEVLDDLSFIFPNATQTFSDTPLSFLNNQNFPPTYGNEQPVIYTQDDAMQSSYSPEISPSIYHATIPQHRPPPLRTRSLPYPTYPSSMAHLTPQKSPSLRSTQPHSPAAPNSNKGNKSILLPKSIEPQIRYNHNCFNYSILKNKSIRLDPASSGSAALSPAHFSNSTFQPVMWNYEEEYCRRDS